MSRMQGPAIFLAQFASQEAPFNSLERITRTSTTVCISDIAPDPVHARPHATINSENCHNSSRHALISNAGYAGRIIRLVCPD